MKKFISTDTIKNLSTEIISIVIGVLLALAVNEWNENRTKQQRSNEALINIVNEIESNIDILTVAHENNATTVKLLAELAAESGDEAAEEDNGSLSFVPALQIQDTAWKTMVSTGVAEFVAYEKLYKVSGIYSLQEIYKDLGMQLIQSMMQHQALVSAINPERSEADNDVFLENMQLLVSVESALLQMYQTRLEQLK